MDDDFLFLFLHHSAEFVSFCLAFFTSSSCSNQYALIRCLFFCLFTFDVVVVSILCVCVCSCVQVCLCIQFEQFAHLNRNCTQMVPKSDE